MGMGIPFAPPGSTPIQRALDELPLGQGAPQPQVAPALDEWLRWLGTLPLMHQPGERWMYNTGSDMLGALIARAAAGVPRVLARRPRALTSENTSRVRRPRPRITDQATALPLAAPLRTCGPAGRPAPARRPDCTPRCTSPASSDSPASRAGRRSPRDPRCSDRKRVSQEHAQAGRQLSLQERGAARQRARVSGTFKKKSYEEYGEFIESPLPDMVVGFLESDAQMQPSFDTTQFGEVMAELRRTRTPR